MRDAAHKLGEHVDVCYNACVFRGESRQGYPFIYPFSVTFIAQAFPARKPKKDGTIANYEPAEEAQMGEYVDILVEKLVIA
jgi:hypothetical protein